MDNALCCVNCGEVVIKSLHNGETKLRAKVIVFRESSCVAICKGCNTEVPVPLVVDTDMMKSMVKTKLRHYVRK